MTRKIAVVVAAVLLLSGPLLHEGWAAGIVRSVEITDVTVGPTLHAYVSVLDDERAHLAGLDAGAFQVSEDGTPVTVNVAEERPGLAVMMLLDLSGSMAEAGVVEGQTRMESQKEAAMQFIDQNLAPEDWVGVLGFHVAISYTQVLTQDHGAARNLVYQMQCDPGKNTALFNTASTALDALHDAPLGPRTRRVLLIFSDGKDYLEKQDPMRYREYRENVARKGRDYGIPIFVVGIGTWCGNSRPCVRNAPENEYNFEDADWLADQTDGGSYHTLTQVDQPGMASFFARLASQGWQYHLSYDSHAPKGDHRLRVQVRAGGGDKADEVSFASPYQLPNLELKGPANLTFQTDGGPVSWEVVPSFPDGYDRPLKTVWLSVDNQLIFTDTTSPYTFTWAVATYKDNTKVDVKAVAEDTIVPGRFETPPQKVTLEIPIQNEVLKWLVRNSVALGVGLLSVVLFIILLRKRQVVGAAVRTAATQARAAITQALGPRALARLKVCQGLNTGREYRLNEQNNYIGRENCNVLVAEGDSMSRQHAFIGLHTTTWYITDLGSKNGTWVDNVPLPPNSPMALRSGSRIRMGDVEFEFSIVGGTTRIITP